MDTTAIQQWHVVYLCAALLVAAATLVGGDHLRTDDPPAVSTQCTAALTAGALWPLIVTGLMQLWVIDRVVRRTRNAEGVPPAVTSERPVAWTGRF